MPRKLSQPSWGRAMRIAGAAGVAGAIAFGGATASAAVCPIPASTPAFAQWGDNNSYFLAPGGDFEGPLTWAHNWSASIVSGNNPFMLAGDDHSRSLRLRSGGSVTTPIMCITPETPHLRFVAKSLGSNRLNVRVRFYGITAGDDSDDWEVTDISKGAIYASDHGSWSPSDNIDLLTRNLAPGTVGYVDVRFKSQGDWMIDDVFVDPFAR